MTQMFRGCVCVEVLVPTAIHRTELPHPTGATRTPGLHHWFPGKVPPTDLWMKGKPNDTVNTEGWQCRVVFTVEALNPLSAGTFPGY